MYQAFGHRSTHRGNNTFAAPLSDLVPRMYETLDIIIFTLADIDLEDTPASPAVGKDTKQLFK